MARFAKIIGLLLLSACHAPEDPTLFVLPGAFAQSTSVADLEARFGKANVKMADVPDYEGAPLGVVLFSDDPTRRAYVGFHDAEQTSLANIAVRDADSRWRGKEGVHIGMPFSELRQRNRKPFYFSGFDDQRRGGAHDQWSPSLDDKDDQLGAFDVAADEHMSFGVDLHLRGEPPADAYPHDEASVSSDDPLYPRLGELAYVSGFEATTSLDDESD